MRDLHVYWDKLSPQGRWRRVLLCALVPMVCAISYYAYETAYFSMHHRPPPR